MRETDDRVEAIGIERAVARGKNADLRLIILAAPDDPLPVVPEGDDIVVIGKADQARHEGVRMISARTGEGVDDLIRDIAQILSRRTAGSGNLIRERQRLAVEQAVGALDSALNELGGGLERIELAAEDVRRASRALDKLIGRIGVEDVLGEIFSSFCIGK